MYLFIGTETNGLPVNYRAPLEDLDNWPRMVQAAWARYDGRGNHLETQSYIIKPEGFSIPRAAQRIHGISPQRARREGVPLKDVLSGLSAAVCGCRAIVAHNISFDEPVIAAEYLRMGMKFPFGRKNRICTMKETTAFCGIPGRRGFKWPRLDELYRALFKDEFKDAHDAGADVEACARCFFELKRRRVLKISKRC